MLLSKSKEEEKKTLEKKYNSLTEGLDNQKKEKKKMLNVDYDNLISGLTRLFFFTAIMALVLHYKTYGIATSSLGKVFYYIVLCGGTVLLCGLELKISINYINKKMKKLRIQMNIKIY